LSSFRYFRNRFWSTVKYIYYSIVLIFIYSCKTTKNTAVHRAFHDVHARYNGYYYATESIKEGTDKMKSEFKEDYEFVLPVYQYATPDNVKSYYPEMDKAIKKSSLVIQRHTITDKNKKEIPSAGHWIDNNWLVVGEAYFFKRDFFQAIETFEYIAKTYKSNEAKEALVWLVRSYNELGNPSNAEPFLTRLQNDKKLPKYLKREMHLAAANYHQILGNDVSVLNELKQAEKYHFTRKDNARLNFIIGQLDEQKQDYTTAYKSYRKVMGKGAEYDLELHAKLKINKLDAFTSGDKVKAKFELLKMASDPKNEEYAGEIHYTIGQLDEGQNDIEAAIKDYKLASSFSKANQKQKASACLRLAEIYYTNESYEMSGKYYDSTKGLLAKSHPKYEKTAERNTSLKNLIEQIHIINNEDSLQRIAKMSDADRTTFIKNLIKKKADFEKAEKDKADKLEAASKLQQDFGNSSGEDNFGSDSKSARSETSGIPQGFGPAAWYMYNPALKAQGINEFGKKFGNRKLEDNWRRSNKEAIIPGSAIPENEVVRKEGKTSNDNDSRNNGTKAKDEISAYLSNLPMSDSAKLNSTSKIVDAYYMLGSIYREQFNDNKNAIITFEKLDTKYHPNKHTAASYYQLYRLYGKMGNLTKANEYKNRIKTEYPESDYAQVIDLVASSGSAAGFVSETEKAYSSAYSAYNNAEYGKALEIIQVNASKAVQPSFAGKFALLKALCIGKTDTLDAFKKALTVVTVDYASEPVKQVAMDILAAMQKLGTNVADATKPEDKSFYHIDQKQVVVMQIGDDPNLFSSLRSVIVDYNTKYYSLKGYTTKDFILGANDFGLQVLVFDDAKEADSYIQNLKRDKILAPLVNSTSVRLFSIDEAHLAEVRNPVGQNAYLLEYNKLKSLNK
jgi:tetratricopeptide (TPR) repeat protein